MKQPLQINRWGKNVKTFFGPGGMASEGLSTVIGPAM
jgi:hypothetical protein